MAAGALGHAIGDAWTAYAAVGAAMLGHAFPLFAGFRGGKAVMTFAGGAFALSLPAATVALTLCGAVTGVTRRFAYGARAGVLCFPLIQLAFDGAERVAATGALMTLIGVLFVVRRTSSPATSSAAGSPTT